MEPVTVNGRPGPARSGAVWLIQTGTGTGPQKSGPVPSMDPRSPLDRAHRVLLGTAAWNGWNVFLNEYGNVLLEYGANFTYVFVPLLFVWDNSSQTFTHTHPHASSPYSSPHPIVVWDKKSCDETIMGRNKWSPLLISGVTTEGGGAQPPPPELEQFDLKILKFTSFQVNFGGWAPPRIILSVQPWG